MSCTPLQLLLCNQNHEGGVPYLGYPEKLAKENVRGVVNLCDEYRGPTGAYERLGIEQLYLPTVDHFEPEVESLKSAVSFIQEHESKGNKGKSGADGQITFTLVLP